MGKDPAAAQGAQSAAAPSLSPLSSIFASAQTFLAASDLELPMTATCASLTLFHAYMSARCAGGEQEGSRRGAGGQQEGSRRAAGGQQEGSRREAGGQQEGSRRAAGGQQDRALLDRMQQEASRDA
eukprot:767701-Hanusia_phi.AAC.7